MQPGGYGYLWVLHLVDLCALHTGLTWDSASHIYIFQVKMEGGPGEGCCCPPLHRQELRACVYLDLGTPVTLHMSVFCLVGTACSGADPGMREEPGTPCKGSVELGLSEAQRFESQSSCLLCHPNPIASRDSWEATRDDDGVPLQRGHRMCRSA